MSRVKVSITLNRKLKKEARKVKLKSRMFLLGKNKKGIITAAIPLRRSGGCAMIPRITGDTLAKAYLQLHKKKLTPVGFGLAGSPLERYDPSLRHAIWEDHNELHYAWDEKMPPIFIDYIGKNAGYAIVNYDRLTKVVVTSAK